MARARNIKPSFFMNDKLADCEPLARLLFAGLWTVADREGRLEDNARKIKAQTLPYDNCDCNDLLNQLEKNGFIIRYNADNNQYIQILKFAEHQNPHVKEGASILPAPDLHHTSTVQNVPLPLSPIPLIESPILNPEVMPPKNYSDGFEEFWQAYPKNGASKKESYKSYCKAIKTGVTQNELIESIRQYFSYCQFTATPIAHATTWLNQERWTVDYRGISSKQGNKPTQGEQIAAGIERLSAEYGHNVHPARRYPTS